MRLPIKKTKIVCTVGPASSDVEILVQMIENGMNVARINFAHGDLDTHRQSIANVRAAAGKVGERVAIMGDLPGPKMRIGRLDEEPIMLEQGQSFVLQTDEILGNKERVSLEFDGLARAVNQGDNIFMNDGYIQLRVDDIIGDEVHCTVRVGGELRSNKGVNFPGIDLGISAFTDDDRELLAFAAEQELDAVSQSFVQNAADIQQVRSAAAVLGYAPMIIAKIERSNAVKNIESILDGADGIMVARGDLGVETPIEEIPSTQKLLIQRANLRGKPVITATQMLESMTNNRRPTRAEVTDVANAILDGTDAVMLSGETAVGAFPVETVAVMSRVARATEENHGGTFGIGELLARRSDGEQVSQEDKIAANIYGIASTLDPSLVFVPSSSGATARRVARFRLPQWIVAPSRHEVTCQRLVFSFGVYPVHSPSDTRIATPEERKNYTLQWLEEYGVRGELVLLLEGSGTLQARDTQRIDLINIR